MKSTRIAVATALLALAACSKGVQPAEANLEEANAAVANEVESAELDRNGANQAAGNKLLAEPKGPVDPRSVEAAGQVVQHYGAFIERSRWLKAERLWGDINLARDFAEDLGKRFGQVHLEIGDLGSLEGAAGSIYTTVPVTFYGPSHSGQAVRLPASVTLRRVNDVPGSTERQRQWHIETIDWKIRA